MLQKLKDWFVDLLGGYSKKEYENQQTILECIYKDKKRIRKRLEIIERDLKITDANYYNIEYIASHLCKALEIIKQKEARDFDSKDYELESLIFAISKSVEILIKSRDNRETKVPYDSTIPNIFLNQYEYFKTSAWKRKESLQFEAGKHKK